MGIIKPIKRLFYSKKEKRHELVGPAELWKMKQKFQVDFMMSMGLKPDHTFIDIGCGTLRGGIPFIKYLDEGNYCGVDVRDEVIKEAHKELEDENVLNKNPDVRSFEVFEDLPYQNQFDIAFAFSVLIHLSDEILVDCLAFVKSALKKDGVFYANVNIGNRSDGKWQGFPIAFRTIEFYEKVAKENGLQVEKMDTLHNLGHQSGKELADQQVMLRITHIE